MTIAACYLSAEGVVVGADSTSTVFVPGPSSQHTGSDRHFDFGQKIFEVGEAATLGIATWGLGSLPAMSYRTMVAELADGLVREPAASIEEITIRWGEQFWREYSTRLDAILRRTHDLARVPTRTPEEENELDHLLQNSPVVSASAATNFRTGLRARSRFHSHRTWQLRGRRSHRSSALQSSGAPPV